MHVRDAVEADADVIATIAEQPAEAVRNTIHDRSVRVAVREAGEPDDTGDGTDSAAEEESDGASSAGADETADEKTAGVTGGGPAEPVAYVAFDARRDAVHLTGFGGDTDGLDRLLAEPVRFAEREGMDVEALVERSDDARRAAIETAGFTEVGSGPQFAGEPTVRYRLRPDRSA